MKNFHVSLAKYSMILNDFLERMKACGYRRVCIHIADPSVPESLNSLYSPLGAQGVAYAWPNRMKGSWPAIWLVCKELGFKGFGNSQQHQVPEELAAGCFHLKNDVWVKVA